MVTSYVQAPTNLANCANEPIHIPGSIQPNGALLVFNAALNLIGWSANVVSMLQLKRVPGDALANMDIHFDVSSVLHNTANALNAGEAHRWRSKPK